MISEENYTVDGKEVMCHFFSFHMFDVLMCHVCNRNVRHQSAWDIRRLKSENEGLGDAGELRTPAVEIHINKRAMKKGGRKEYMISLDEATKTILLIY